MLDIGDVRLLRAAEPSDEREGRATLPSPFNPPLIALTVTIVFLAMLLVFAVLDPDHVSAAEARGQAPAAASCADRPGR
jgi:hypothetical protein